MNYFAHGRHFLDQPYVVAGTALPDWLGVVNRRIRLRERRVRPLAASGDPCTRELASGVLRHLHDDAWFHRTRAFAELTLQFSVRLREQLPADDGLRPGFLGHILVEMLLDDCLARRQPRVLSRYYECLGQVDADRVELFVRHATGKRPDRLAEFIDRFREVRFLYDYAQDGTLLFRLNQVMQRVRLPALPDAVTDVLPELRSAVWRRMDELLAPAQAESEPTDPSTSTEGKS